MFEGSTIHVAGSDPVVLANRVQSPSIRGNTIKGPYLTIVVAGQYPEAHGYAPLRGYAQPIYSGKRFIPVDSEFERAVLSDQTGTAAGRERVWQVLETSVGDVSFKKNHTHKVSHI